MLSAARALEAWAPDAAGLHRAGSVLIFLSLLSLLMNGFLSWLPVHPWAKLALTLGSLAGTSFCLAALAISPANASRQPHLKPAGTFAILPRLVPGVPDILRLSSELTR